MRHPILFLASLTVLAACDSGAETRKAEAIASGQWADAVMAAKGPASPTDADRSAGRRWGALKPAGPTRTIMPLTGPIDENAADVFESWDREAEYGRFLVIDSADGKSGYRLYLVFRALGSKPEVAFLVGEGAGWRQLGDDGETILLDSSWEYASSPDTRPETVVRLHVEPTPDQSAPASITATPMRFQTAD